MACSCTDNPNQHKSSGTPHMPTSQLEPRSEIDLANNRLTSTLNSSGTIDTNPQDQHPSPNPQQSISASKALKKTRKKWNPISHTTCNHHHHHQDDEADQNKYPDQKGKKGKPYKDRTRLQHPLCGTTQQPQQERIISTDLLVRTSMRK